MSRPCPARCIDGRTCTGRTRFYVCGAHALAFARGWLGGSSIAWLAKGHAVPEDAVERTVRQIVKARQTRAERALRETDRIARDLHDQRWVLP